MCLALTNTHLSINDLWHCYGARKSSNWSLKEINLDIREGELLGILGPSGCGKTTLLRLIAGFERPHKGRIYLNGKQVANSRNIEPPENRCVGMVFQDYALFPHLDAWTNVCFGLRRGQDKSRVNWLLEILGLVDLRNRFPHELSGGQRQRLALARALAPGTSLVLLDEPFSNLDVEVRLRLRSELPKVLKSCSASGILVTHDPQEALAICDRVAVLRDGELHQCTEPNNLVHKPATPFVGRFVLQRNVVPVEIFGTEILTPLGPIKGVENIRGSSANELMIDEKSLQIKRDPNGKAKILGREFLGNHWRLRVKLSDFILRIQHPLDQPIQVGENCFVGFRPGESGILFPGTIPCKFN